MISTSGHLLTREPLKTYEKKYYKNIGEGVYMRTYCCHDTDKTHKQAKSNAHALDGQDNGE